MNREEKNKLLTEAITQSILLLINTLIPFKYKIQFRFLNQSHTILMVTQEKSFDFPEFV